MSNEPTVPGGPGDIRAWRRKALAMFAIVVFVAVVVACLIDVAVSWPIRTG